VLWDDNAPEAQKNAARHTLLSVLEASLRLLHPPMPFISEEIWQRAAPLLRIQGETIMLQPYPEVEESVIDRSTEAEIEWLKAVITGIRNIRGELNISPARSIPAIFAGGEEDKSRLDANRQFLLRLAKLEDIGWAASAVEAPPSATALAGEMEILVPLAGLIDVKAELARLDKEIDKLVKEMERIDTKLGNARFVDNAPREVVDKERE